MHYNFEKTLQTIRSDPIHYVLVMSHGKRVHTNREMNKRLAKGRNDTLELEPADVKRGPMANMPQKMRIWPGTTLPACVKVREANEVNGLEYEVICTTNQNVELRRLHPSGDVAKHGVPFELPHAETALKMILQHALCYYTAQGRTLRDSLVLCTDTDHQAFTRRHLITGIGRVCEGTDMEV